MARLGRSYPAGIIQSGAAYRPPPPPPPTTLMALERMFFRRFASRVWGRINLLLFAWWFST